MVSLWTPEMGSRPKSMMKRVNRIEEKIHSISEEAFTDKSRVFSRDPPILPERRRMKRISLAVVQGFIQETPTEIVLHDHWGQNFISNDVLSQINRNNYFEPRWITPKATLTGPALRKVALITSLDSRDFSFVFNVVHGGIPGDKGALLGLEALKSLDLHWYPKDNDCVISTKNLLLLPIIMTVMA